MKLMDVIQIITQRNPDRFWVGLTDGIEWYDFRFMNGEEYQKAESQDATDGNLWWEPLTLSRRTRRARKDKFHPQDLAILGGDPSL
jgi:hypothetical protein